MCLASRTGGTTIRILVEGPDLLGGVTLPEGALDALPWASASCDETAFDDPDELILDPPNVGLDTAFGRAVHHCVGAPLARLEARVVVTKWLGRTPNVALDPNSNRAGPTVCGAAQQGRPIVLEPGARAI